MKSFFELGNEISIDNLINTLSKEFYNGNTSPEEILKAQKLFFRQIKLK